MGKLRDHYGQHKACHPCHVARVVNPDIPDSAFRRKGYTDDEVKRIRKISPVRKQEQTGREESLSPLGQI